MSESFLMALPIVIFNLGGEMIYILCSRLKAQKIPEDRCRVVIHDMVRNLFEKKMMDEIKKHKQVSKHQEVRQMFEKLAHSSIMRLNPTSMAKLFELMLMSLKLQVLRSRYPEEIYQITLNHLESVRDIVTANDEKKNSNAPPLVEAAIRDFKETYGKLSKYDYYILKQTLLRFLQGKNVKVSIFIQDFLQSNTGVIYLPMGEKAPPFVEEIGRVRYRTGIMEKFELKLSNEYIANDSKDRMAGFETKLGLNMFSGEKLTLLGRNKQAKDVTKEFNLDKKEEEKVKEPPKPAEEKKPKTTTTEQPNPVKDTGIQQSALFSETDRSQVSMAASTKREFKELADLLVVPTNNDKGTFKLDLFGSDNKDGNEDENYIVIEREESSIKKKFDVFNDILKESENKDNNEDSNNDDDLLDLMDKAVASGN